MLPRSRSRIRLHTRPIAIGATDPGAILFHIADETCAYLNDLFGLELQSVEHADGSFALMRTRAMRLFGLIPWSQTDAVVSVVAHGLWALVELNEPNIGGALTDVLAELASLHGITVKLVITHDDGRSITQTFLPQPSPHD